MSYNRVIQDSDDEDDPLAQDFLPPANPRHNPQGYAQEPDNYNPQHVSVAGDGPNTNNGQIGVNFDDFLQSQEAAQSRLTSSQQRREERWIPTVAEGAGSIGPGSMMTEIGLAQRRLFDEEETQYAHQYIPQPVPYDESAQGTEYTPEHVNGIAQIGYGGYNASVLPNQQPDPSYPNNFPYANGAHDQYTHNIQICPPHPDALANQHDSLSSHNHSNPATSYNFFESSLRPSTNSYSDNLNNTTIILPHGLPNAEGGYKSPRRSNSYGPLSSPHDTEPNSSVLRARSDNAGLMELQHSAAIGSVDELTAPAPVVIELPQIPVEKKRGRKKKVIAPPADDEDDELAQPITSRGAITNTTAQPEKRKPGRPPKNAKKAEESNYTETNGVQGPSVELPVDGPINDSNGINASATNGTHAVAEIQSTEPAKTKERLSRKKKLKRGKTTSVTVQKTYASDVEDDVIWVDDERPTKPSSGEQYEPAELAPPTDNNLESGLTEIKENILPEQSETTTPAPKKRGRKRKIPAEQLPAADEPATGEPTQEQQITAPLVDDTNNANPIDPQNQDSLDNTQLQEHKETHHPETDPNTNLPQPPSTPPRPSPQTPSTTKGPTKHSPISTTGKVPYRVGLSRRARIAPLLKIVRR